VALLLAGGARVDARGSTGHAPLLYAFLGREKAGGPGLACARLLLAAGADVEAADWAGRSALHELLSRADAPGAMLLVEAGAKLDSRMAGDDGSEGTGLTAVEYALLPGALTGRRAPSDARIAACVARVVAFADQLALRATTRDAAPRKSKAL
jgi:ankyrin repeat protein